MMHMLGVTNVRMNEQTQRQSQTVMHERRVDFAVVSL